MIWWQFTFNMHLSCKWTWWAFSGMYSTYLLLQADSACKNVHNLVHDVVPQKDMFLQGTYLFGSFVIFKTVCPSSIFGQSGRCPSSSIRAAREPQICVGEGRMRATRPSRTPAIHTLESCVYLTRLFVISDSGSRVSFPARRFWFISNRTD